MAKPRLIILIRHAQSEGNKNREIHQTIPDHRVKLTQEGWQQAYEAGRKLRAMLRADDTLHFFTSPYRRTRETTEGILASLTSDDPEPSAFKRNNIKVYEEPRLREQDFGNFQPCSAEMERMWQERADYGHFFYRIPDGESAADAYDRISGFNESLWRQFGEDDFASVCVLVTHGLMSRVFLMKWYHFSVEYFEDLRNVNHCEFLIMNKQESGKYVLENKLRTWSELRRERALLTAKEKGDKNGDGKTNGLSKDSSKLDKANSQHRDPSSPAISSPVETRRRWGGCPNGCNHDKNFRIRPGLADLVRSDITAAAPPVIIHHAHHNGDEKASDADHSGESSPTIHRNPSFNGNGQANTIVSRRPAGKRFQAQNAEAEEPEEAGPQIDITRARDGHGNNDDGIISSPDGTPSFISVEDRLRGHLRSPDHTHDHVHDDSSSHADDEHHNHNHHGHSSSQSHSYGHSHSHYADRLLHVGRDGGGTYSGHNSVVASDADSSEDEAHRRRRMAAMAARPKLTTIPSSSSKLLSSSSMAETNGNANGEHTPKRGHSRMGRGIRANRLGDAPHSSDGEHEADAETEPDDEKEMEMDREEGEERSVQASVY